MQPGPSGAAHCACVQAGRHQRQIYPPKTSPPKRYRSIPRTGSNSLSVKGKTRMHAHGWTAAARSGQTRVNPDVRPKRIEI